MCLAVPGEIKSINNSGPLKMAKVDFNGVEQDICIEWVPEAKLGDYVLAHVGTALSILDEESAKASLETFSEMEELLEQDKMNTSTEDS